MEEACIGISLRKVLPIDLEGYTIPPLLLTTPCLYLVGRYRGILSDNSTHAVSSLVLCLCTLGAFVLPYVHSDDVGTIILYRSPSISI